MIRPGWPARRRSVWQRAIGVAWGVLWTALLVWALLGAAVPGYPA